MSIRFLDKIKASNPEVGMCHPKGIAQETIFGSLIIPRKDLQQTQHSLCLSLPQDSVGASVSEIIVLFGNYPLSR